MNIMNRLLVCLLATMFVVSVGAVGVNALNFKTINDPLYFWIDGTVAENTHTDFVDVTILPLNDIRWNTDPGLEGTYKFDPTGSGILEGTPHKNDWGLHTATIYAEHNATDNNTKTIDILVTNKGDDGALAIDGDKIKVSGKTMDFGEKLSKKFKLGDTLELEFDLENTYDEDADDIDIEDIDITAWIEKDGKTFGEEVDLDDEFTIDAEEKEEDIALNIEIPKDEDDEGTFTLYVVAEGTDSNGNPAVEVFYGQIEIDREKHELLIDEDEISWEPSEIKPGEKVKLEVPIYNIGSSSKEEEIKLTVKNDDLKIESTVDVVEELDRADDDTAEIWINIPRTVKSGKYFLDFEVDYKSSEDKYSIPIEIVGGVDADALEGLVSLTLSQTSMSAAPGSMSKFSVTLENTGDAEEEFELALVGADTWADWQINPETVILDEGETETVSVYVTPKSNMFGSRTAALNIMLDNEIIGTESLTVNVVGGADAAGTLGTNQMFPKTLTGGGIQAALVGLIIVLVIVALLMFAFRPRRE